MNDQIQDQSASVTGAGADAPRWYVVLSMSWLRLVRYGVLLRVVSPRRALLLTSPWFIAANRAGLRLPARFYEVAADAGVWPEQAQ